MPFINPFVKNTVIKNKFRLGANPFGSNTMITQLLVSERDWFQGFMLMLQYLT